MDTPAQQASVQRGGAGHRRQICLYVETCKVRMCQFPWWGSPCTGQKYRRWPLSLFLVSGTASGRTYPIPAGGIVQNQELSLGGQQSTVVNGVVVNGRYVPREDIEIVALPLTTDELPRLPDRDRIVPSDYLGTTLVSLQTSASPALFCPRQDDKDKTAITRTKGKVGFATLCDALSLQANSHVSWTFVWTEHGDAAPFCLRDWQIVGDERFEHLMWKSRTWEEVGRKTGAVSIELGEHVSITILDETKLLSVMEALQSSDKKLRIAVDRWSRSMRPRFAIVDRLIALRIALEALYLKNFTNEKSQEMRFRLALIEAWHLGETFARRQQIRKVLCDAYDTASGAVHTGEAPAGADETLKKAGKLCREGILKLLREGPPADWGNLILGPDQ